MKVRFAIVVFVLMMMLSACMQAAPIVEPTQEATSTSTPRPTVTATVTMTPTITITSTPTLTPTPQPATMLLDLELDDLDDQNWFDFPFEEPGHVDQLPGELVLYDGGIHLGGSSPVDWTNPKSELYVNYILHMRLRTGSSGPCHAVAAYIPLDNGERKVIALSGCPNASYNTYATLDDGMGGGVSAWLETWGTVPVIANEWIDMALWVHPDGDKLFYAIANASDPDHILYGGASLPENWQTGRWRLDVSAYMYEPLGTENQYLDIDFFKIARGDFATYLYYNFPAYLIYEEEIDQYLSETPPMIDESTFSDLDG